MTNSEKLQAKRDRYAARAQKARDEATAAYEASKERADRIPMGQPILVGHHSERKHRRDLAKIDRDMRKSIDAIKRAEHYERKAAGVGKGGISADDPDAIEKITARIAELEETRDAYKAHNKKARSKAGRESGIDPVPGYSLTNLGANIRRLKRRLEGLKRDAETPESPDISGDGWRIEQSKDDNRVRFYFDEKPDRDTCKAMKRAGFRWAPSVGAWQRQLTHAGVYAAKRMANQLFGWEWL